jgi:hypothetical protein
MQDHAPWRHSFAAGARAVGTLVSRHRIEAVGFTGLLLALTIAWWRQRCEPPTVGLAVASLLVLAVAGGWWRTHRRGTLLVAVNTALIFGYLWSLDDTVHVVIAVTATQYRAEIGNDVAIAPRPAGAGNRIVLFSGSAWDYHVTPLGEVYDPRSAWVFSDIGTAVRFGTLGPAWSQVRLTTASGSTNLLAGPFYALSGAWYWNGRHELANQLNSNTQIGVAPLPPYTIQADLHRGDGTQGIVLGLNDANIGTVLTVRLDDPDMQWFTYRSGVAKESLGGLIIHPTVREAVQRDTRLLLGNVIAALLVLLVVVPAYLGLAALFSLTGEPYRGEVETAIAVLRDRRVAVGVTAVVALLVCGFGAWLSTDLLQRIPHVQDSVADLFQARIFALGRLSAPAPRYSEFFSFQFVVVHGGQWFGKYAPGWALLLAVGVIAHAAWLVNPLLGGINVILTYLLARELYGRAVAILSALLVAISPFFLFLTGEYMAHGATLAYLSGAAVCLLLGVRGAGTRRQTWLLLAGAGFLLGMAGITRQFDAIAWAIPLGIVAIAKRRRRILGDIGPLALGLAIPTAFLLFDDWRLTGSPWTQPYTLWSADDRPGFGATIGPLGHTVGEGIWNLGFNLQSLLTDLFGWPFYLTLAFAALPFLLCRARREDWLGASIVGLLAALYVTYWGNGVMYGPRYYYTAIPWLAMLTVRGLVELYRLLLRLPSRQRDPMAAAGAVGLLTLLLVAYAASVYLPPQLDLYRQNYNYASARELHAVARAQLQHALVFVVTDPPDAWWDYGVAFSANSPLLDGNVVYARDLGGEDAVLERAYPHRTPYRLRGARLTRLSAAAYDASTGG